MNKTNKQIKDRKPGLYVKSKEEIIKWLEDKGYDKTRSGDYYREEYLDFASSMFDYCGEKINSNTKEFIYNDTEYYTEYGFFWLPEWLEEVAEKTWSKTNEQN